MDLTQSKLTKTEWESIERQVSDSEKKILQVILDGYYDVNIRYNDNQSMIQLLKMSGEDSTEFVAYFYQEYFI